MYRQVQNNYGKIKDNSFVKIIRQGGLDQNLYLQKEPSQRQQYLINFIQICGLVDDLILQTMNLN